MPADLLRRIDLDKLYLPFTERLMQLLANCRARGVEYHAISGYRSDAEQMALWAQGRTREGPIVTNARAGESAHNYGLAVDLCRDADVDRRGLQPDWSPEAYEVLGEEARKLGLVWGGDWRRPDRPHVQWPGYVTARDLEPLRAINAQTGLQGVWMYLDAEQEEAT